MRPLGAVDFRLDPIVSKRGCWHAARCVAGCRAGRDVDVALSRGLYGWALPGYRVISVAVAVNIRLMLAL
jgi:hypothetical protein